MIYIAVTWMHAMATNCTGYIVLIDREICIYVPWSRLDLNFYTLLYTSTLILAKWKVETISHNLYNTIHYLCKAVSVSSKSAQTEKEVFAKKPFLFCFLLPYCFWRIILPFYHALQNIAKVSKVQGNVINVHVIHQAFLRS